MSARADSKDATATAPVTEQNNGRDNGRHKEVRLSENARTVLTKRYLRRGLDGKPAETIEEMFWRVASHVAEPDREYTGNVEETSEAFYDLLTDLLFMPNSPTFNGAGTPLGQLAACFVLPIVDDMGRHPDGIFSTLRNAALIQQTGGGNGFSFSRLRPKNDAVLSSVGVASGPVGFLRVYDAAFGEIAQGGCLLPETLVFTDNGLLRLDEIADTQISGWQPQTLQVATDEGLRPSPRAFNNGVAPVLRVHTREGLSLAGTPEHRVKVMTEQGLQWRALQDLRSGYWISVHLRQHRGRFQALRQPRREHGNQAWPNLPHVLDEELAFFLGYLIGDGFVASQPEDHRVGVSVAHTSYLITEMPALLERLFGVTIHRQQKPNDRSITFVMDNRAVKEFLLLNGLDKPRSREACTPRLIRQSPPGIIGAFLRGLFEADGTFSQGYPSLMTVSPRLAEEVATLLIGLGCPVRVRSIAPGVDHWGHGRMYQVRIQSSAGLQAWRDRIGCDLRSRFVAGYSWESDLSRESTYVLPASRYWLQPVLDAITLEQVDARGRSLGRKFRSRSPRLRRTLLRYLRGDRQFTRSAYDQLCRTYPNFALHARSPQDWWFVQVRDVQPLGESLTLDLEVDGNHTYLAYGMVTHNTRRGANMAVLRVDHPDIEEFIECKSEEGTIVNFNISVGITDAFMRAVEADADFALVNPRAQQSVRTVKARELFDKIARYAHRNGEPGLLFLDTANRGNPVPHLYELEATNPCGEQWLGAYENCCLGSINLAQHVTPDGEVDWKKLQESTEVSTHFLDNVVTANAYVPAVPQLKEAAHRARRIGLGIMGLADMRYHLGIRYGSEEGQEFAAQVMEFVRYHCMRTSIKLAKQRGPFLAMEGSIYDPNDLKWSPPQPLKPYTRDWGRPNLNWDKVVDGIKRHGIRNAAQTTVAPTGTIATVSGCEGYGCEPVFALAYFRNFKDGDKNVQLTYASPLFDKALQEAGLDEAARQRIVDEVGRVGSCQGVMELPDWVRHTYVVSQDITAEEHVFMQAAIQAFVDNSISKCVTGDTLILTDQGLVPVAELSDMRLPDQFQAHELMVFTPNGVEHSDTFYYGGMRETRRVHLSYGYEIEGTPNHPIQTLGTDGRIRFTPLDELRVGETVVLYSGQEAFGPEHQPLPSYSGPWRTNSKDVRFPERMTTELAYLLGCITSEGSISRNGVTITHSSAQVLTRLGDICHNLFGLASHLIRDTRRESVYTL
ncbi:MAG: adenosylcobalamin-dependent ribonucleoside-diphosphate reductase, partial [Anaerolineae bacterium]|nr:adenosylcobalamin-dependent ribonucleoside-diphosphate reductase [Anaerolineae bacterium]